MARDETDGEALPWREREFLTLRLAADAISLSPASLYKFAEEGRLELRRLGGRTLVRTSSLRALLASAEEWTPSGRTSTATRARSERTRLEWDD